MKMYYGFTTVKNEKHGFTTVEPKKLYKTVVMLWFNAPKSVLNFRKRSICT